MTSTPFLIPLIALIIGIVIGESLQLPAWGIAPMLMACGVYAYLLKKSSTPLLALSNNKKHLVWVILLFLGIGMFDSAMQKPYAPTDKELSSATIAEGEIIEVKSFATGDQFIVNVTRTADSLSNIQTYRNFKILLSSEGFSANPGDVITFIPKFSPITENPNLRPSGYVERMHKSGLHFISRAHEGDIRIKGFNNSPVNSALAWRNNLVSKIEKSSLSRPAVNFIVALLLGERSFLSEDIRSTFNNAGVAHVLALSGMHVAIIMGILMVMLLPLKLIGLHKLRFAIAILTIWAFAFFTGMSPSTIRACLMTTFAIIALNLQRRNNAENALLAAAFIILLFDPYALYDIGLQLSFLCVGSILVFVGTINPVNHRAHPALHSIVAAILVSLISTVTTWVVVSYYFNSVPLLFLPVNLCLLPFLPFYIWIAVIFIILLLFGMDSSVLSWILNKGYEIFEWIATTLSGHGESVISVNAQLPIVIVWLIGVLTIAYAIKTHSNKKRTIMIGGVTMLIIAITSVPLLNDKAQDSIIFQKNNHNITLALYEGDQYQLSTLPRNTVSRVIHKGCEILSIDCRLNVDSISSQMINSRKRKRRFLILGSGFHQSSLSEIPCVKDFDKIILHSSLKRKMENKLLIEATELGLKNIHSLRIDGPLEELLPDSLSTTR